MYPNCLCFSITFEFCCFNILHFQLVALIPILTELVALDSEVNSICLKIDSKDGMLFYSLI